MGWIDWKITISVGKTTYFENYSGCEARFRTPKLSIGGRDRTPSHSLMFASAQKYVAGAKAKIHYRGIFVAKIFMGEGANQTMIATSILLNRLVCLIDKLKKLVAFSAP